MPVSPTRLSRPIVGVAKRVRVIDGIPTVYVRAIPTMQTSIVSHPGRSVTPSTDRNNPKEPTV